VPVKVPRDRAGSFEPVIVPEHARRLAGFDDQVISPYAKGMTTGDITDAVVQEMVVGILPSPSRQANAFTRVEADQAVTHCRAHDAGRQPVTLSDGGRRQPLPQLRHPGLQPTRSPGSHGSGRTRSPLGAPRHTPYASETPSGTADRRSAPTTA
jgi:hypothetical protein